MRAVKFEIAEQTYIEERGPNCWAIVKNQMTLGLDGFWDYEPFPSSGTEEYLILHRYKSPEEAESLFNTVRKESD